MDKKPTNKRVLKKATLILLVVSVALFCYALFSYISENVLVQKPYSPPPVAQATATPQARPTAASQATATPIPTPKPRYAPTHLYFPDREVDMEVLPVGLDEKGRMAALEYADKAAWYEPGPVPGDDGNALINGHVRWKKKVGTFSILPELNIGERVVTEHLDGSTRTFYVVSIDIYPFDNVPKEVMNLGGDRRVTLITCNGEFDRKEGTSVNRCIVVCKLPEDIE